MGDFAKFRGTLGGFNRKDVCTWIESSAKEQRKVQEDLQQELTRLTEENDRLRLESMLLQAELTDYEAMSLKNAQREQEQQQSEREHHLLMDELRCLYQELEKDCRRAKELLSQTMAENQAAARQNQDRMEALDGLLQTLSDHLSRSRAELPEGPLAQVPLESEPQE